MSGTPRTDGATGRQPATNSPLPQRADLGALRLHPRHQAWQPRDGRPRSTTAEILGRATVAGAAGKQVLDAARIMAKFRQAVPADERWRVAAARLALRAGVPSEVVPDLVAAPRHLRTNRLLNLALSKEGRSFTRQLVSTAPELSILDPNAPVRSPHAYAVPRTGALGALRERSATAARRIPDTVTEFRQPDRTWTPLDRKLLKISSVGMIGLNALQAPTALANIKDGLRDGPEGLVNTTSGRTGALQGAGTLLAAATLPVAVRQARASGAQGLSSTAWRSLAAPIFMRPLVVRAGLLTGGLTVANELQAFDRLNGSDPSTLVTTRAGRQDALVAGTALGGGGVAIGSVRRARAAAAPGASFRSVALRALTTPVAGPAHLLRAGAVAGALLVANRLGAFGFLDD